jgi:hypothetical protein
VHTDFQPAVRHLNTRALTVFPMCAVALLVISLQKFLTVFLLCLSGALDGKEITGFFAHPVTLSAFMCHLSVFRQHLPPQALSRSSAEVDLLRAGPSGNSTSDWQPVVKSTDGSFQYVCAGSREFGSVI